MFKELETVDWQKMMEYGQTPDQMIQTLYECIWPRFESCFPLIKVRISLRDQVFMSPLVKHLLQKNKAAARRDERTTLCLQNQINTLIGTNQLNAVQCENQTQKTGTKKWWENVNNITGRKDKNLPISSLIEPNEIYTYFLNINIDPNYSAPVPSLAFYQ